MRSSRPRASDIRVVAMVAVMVFASGCGTVPAVPEVRYYRLPSIADQEPAGAEAFQQALVIEPLSADGVYNEQAILYAIKPEGSIRPYHYQLWSDPPGRLLQRRLIASMRSARMAPLVTDRLPASQPSLRLTGLIQRFERVGMGEGRWKIHVAMQFRLDRESLPLLQKNYRAEVEAESASIQATVRAFAKAIDQCFGELRGDLAGLATP